MKIRRLLAKLPFRPDRILAPVVPVVRLSGVIGGVGPLRRGLSLAALHRELEKAFTTDGAVAVALSVNSPGGSAVQSALIHRRIRALADEHGIKVIAFAEDVAASGGYWLALAGDEIYADAASIIGSIGVISAGFGFAEAIARLGIERRVYTSGERKSILDPFRPEDPEDVARIAEIQADIHAGFKALVKARRGAKLSQDDNHRKELFSGAFWTGNRALEMGLIDGLGDLGSVLRERFGAKVRFRFLAEERGRLWRRFQIGPGPGDWAESALGALEARGLWSRYGL